MKLQDDLKMALLPVSAMAGMLGLTLDDWQAKLLDALPHRVLLNIARQCGKSTISSIIALYVALFFQPGALILLVSPSLRQSAELFRRVIQFHRLLTTEKPLAESVLRLELHNGSRIVSLPGNEGTVRGYSAADLVVIDEAARVSDELLAAIRPMLAVSNGKLICMSTPAGKRGWFWKQWTMGGDNWHRFTLRADQCPRILPEFLEEERRILGDFLFQQEYECTFMDAETSVFSSALIEAALSSDVKPLWS